MHAHSMQTHQEEFHEAGRRIEEDASEKLVAVTFWHSHGLKSQRSQS